MLDKVYKPREIDSKWMRIWSERGVFKADASSPDPAFSVILPPPNITGILTVGHALGTTVQDILCRWKRSKGHNVLWLPGTDHAGIATQRVVERSLEERGLSKEALGRKKFVRECWKWKEKYHSSIVDQLERLGASLDWSRETFTLDPAASRAVREVFVRLYDKGLIYSGRYIVNWCPVCGTAISDEEVVYKEQQGKLYYIAYPFEGGGGEMVVGTTRPETMLGDVAVAISPECGEAGEMEGRLIALPLTDRTIPVILDEAVDPAFGTGCLKVTPAHDATDFEIGSRHGLEPVTVIDREGKMNDEAGRFAGLDRFEARERILEALGEKGLLRKIEDYENAVGHHDRCEAAIEPFISRQWFLRMKPLSQPALAVAGEGGVLFFPERWKNIYISWMENIRDWCISRQLWWGHRIPVWYCKRCGIEKAAVEAPERCEECGDGLVQDEDVLDTWFSSWLWTFSPMGWPEKTADLETFHPTNVLVTGGDIIFFWVARMVMASLEFMDEVPFSDVYLTGIVRDTAGRKMSKSLGNSPDPVDIVSEYGADAFRFTLTMLSPPGQDLLFDVEKVEVGRHFANKIWNAARLVLSQVGAGSAGSGSERDTAPISELHIALFGRPPRAGISYGWEDRWIASRLAARMIELDRSLGAYRFDEAAKGLYDFFWHEFCDWYLELSKPAFKSGGTRSEGAAATARTVLGASMFILHPFMPFISEEIWSILAAGCPLLAEHRLPDLPAGIRDAYLEADVDLFREIVSAIRNLRQSFNVSPSMEVDAIINCEPGLNYPRKLEPYRDPIRLLARVCSLEIAEGGKKPEGYVAAGLTSIEIYVRLEGIIDLDVERKRLKKDLEKATGDFERIAERLRDDRFLKRAPTEVVNRERDRFEEIGDRRRRIERILEELG